MSTNNNPWKKTMGLTEDTETYDIHVQITKAFRIVAEIRRRKIIKTLLYTAWIYKR